MTKYPAILPKLRYLPEVRLDIRHFLTLAKGPAPAGGSAFELGQRSGSGRRVKSNLRLNTGTMSSFRKKSLRRKDVNLQVAVDQRERESIVAEAGRHSERARVSFGGHEGRGKTAPVMRFWLRKRPQLLHFTLSHPPPPPTAFPRHFEADLPPPPPPG